MSENKHVELQIERLPKGGFVVLTGFRQNSGFLSGCPLFACTEIDDALAFIKDEIATTEAAPAAVTRLTGTAFEHNRHGDIVR